MTITPKFVVGKLQTKIDVARSAACRDSDPELFFPLPKQDASEAVSLCGQCDIREECLLTALVNRELDGIWGGYGPDERRSMLRSKTYGLHLARTLADKHHIQAAPDQSTKASHRPRSSYGIDDREAAAVEKLLSVTQSPTRHDPLSLEPVAGLDWKALERAYEAQVEADRLRAEHRSSQTRSRPNAQSDTAAKAIGTQLLLNARITIPAARQELPSDVRSQPTSAAVPRRPRIRSRAWYAEQLRDNFDARPTFSTIRQAEKNGLGFGVDDLLSRFTNLAEAFDVAGFER